MDTGVVNIICLTQCELEVFVRPNECTGALSINVTFEKN